MSKIAARAGALCGALALLCALGCEAAQDGIIRRVAANAQAFDRSDWLADDAVHVGLCGTGSPLPDASRAAACTAVIAAVSVVFP